MINKRKILRSFISYIPFAKNILKKTSTSPSSGKYYFDIYKNHKDKIINSGIEFSGDVIGEIGPGDSLGVGFCAILDGFDKYYALDVKKFSNVTKNLNLLDELKSYFPEKLEKIEEIKNINKSLNNQDSYIHYYVPWNSDTNIKKDSIDIIIITNAVMEHIIELEDTYIQIYKWLKPGGVISSVIDYGAHEFSNIWFEHLYLNNIFWKFLLNGRMYPINRFSHSFHLDILKKVGFKILTENRNIDIKADIKKVNRSLRQTYNDDDLKTRSGYILASKPKN